MLEAEPRFVTPAQISFHQRAQFPKSSVTDVATIGYSPFSMLVMRSSRRGRRGADGASFWGAVAADDATFAACGAGMRSDMAASEGCGAGGAASAFPPGSTRLTIRPDAEPDWAAEG